MWQVARNRLNPTSITLLTFTVMTLLLLLYSTSRAGGRENHTDNLRAMLENANTRTEGTSPITLVFKFNQPLMDTGETLWEIPYYSQEEDIVRWIGEIGNDYLCFYERAGSAVVIRCTPFSNIVAVSYLEN
jgi:hypothetical protein